VHGFEGYVGIRLWDGEMISDLLFSLLLGLLILFAVIFRRNSRLFEKMLRDVLHVRDRLSLFEDVSGNETLFRNFMIFQSMFLSALFIFLVCRNTNYIFYYPDVLNNLKIIGVIFIILFTYYLLKQLIYVTIGMIFTTPEQYGNWHISYAAATGLWGTLQYIPVIWLSFIRGHENVAVIMFIIMFIIWRLVIIYKIVRIFDIKIIGILYVFLYLCTLEILPLLLLCEGTKYLYNFIDELALWN
jgi:hypothetical protein